MYSVRWYEVQQGSRQPPAGRLSVSAGRDRKCGLARQDSIVPLYTGEMEDPGPAGDKFYIGLDFSTQQVRHISPYQARTSQVCW